MTCNSLNTTNAFKVKKKLAHSHLARTFVGRETNDGERRPAPQGRFHTEMRAALRDMAQKRMN